MPGELLAWVLLALPLLRARAAYLPEELQEAPGRADGRDDSCAGLCLGFGALQVGLFVIGEMRG